MRFKNFAILAFVFMIGSEEAAWPQSRDFLTNSQLSGQLAAGASGCPTGAVCSSRAPGFNPTDLVNHADPNATISGAPKIAGGTRPFFSQLGPGAITDNMFGAISRVHPGADGVFNTADDDSTQCGRLPGDPNTGAGVAPSAVGLNNSSLNCGDLRFDPTSQGQTLPSLPATNIVQFVLNPITRGEMNGDVSPSTGTHTGFDLTNSFSFVLSPPSTAGTQQMRQVTALTAGGTAATVGAPGTLATPGSGDQEVKINTSWSVTGTFNSATNRPTVNWSMSLGNAAQGDVDFLTPTTAPFPTNQSDSANGMSVFTSDGSFTYNSGTFPQTVIPSPCWWTGCTVPSGSVTIP